MALPTNTNTTSRMMNDDATTATRGRWIVGAIVILAVIGLFYWGSNGNWGAATNPNSDLPAASAPTSTGTAPIRPVTGSSRTP